MKKKNKACEFKARVCCNQPIPGTVTYSYMCSDEEKKGTLKNTHNYNNVCSLRAQFVQGKNPEKWIIPSAKDRIISLLR